MTDDPDDPEDAGSERATAPELADPEEDPPLSAHPAMLIIDRLLQGDPGARDELMLRWYKMGLGRRNTQARGRLPESIIEELRIKAVLDAVEKAAAGKVTSNPDVMYLHTVAGNISNALSRARNEQKLAELVQEGGLGDDDWLSQTITQPSTHEQLEIQETLDEMDEEELDILLMVEREGRTAEEVAEILGRHPQTIRRKLKDAKKSFARIHKKKESKP